MNKLKRKTYTNKPSDSEYNIKNNSKSIHPMQNRTGMPDKLKAGIETLSGLSMNDVRVHYNSSKPAQLQAYAYTQGTNIYIAPGQEKYLSHEAWHVVQQKQHRVRPTMKMNGVHINDNSALEHEADIKGDISSKINSIEPLGLSENSNTDCEVTQLAQKILNSGHIANNQSRLIGINLMPSGGLSTILPGDGRGYSVLSDKIAGHTSLISGTLNNNNNPQFLLSQGNGFSPDGIINSAIVGVMGFLSRIFPVPNPNVAGNYHNEPQAIVNDPAAHQLLVYVTPNTAASWEAAMRNNNNMQGNGGIYSYAPQSANAMFFGGNGSDNCTTIALRNAFNICTSLMYDLSVNNPLHPDIPPLDLLRMEILNIMNYVNNRNLVTHTTVGTQGRAIAAFDNIR